MGVQSTVKIYDLGRTAAKLDVQVGFQVLRRTMNTLMLPAWVDRINLRDIIGHSTEIMTELYAGGPDLKDKMGRP